MTNHAPTARYWIAYVPGTGYRIEIGPAFGTGPMRLATGTWPTTEAARAHVRRIAPAATAERGTL